MFDRRWELPPQDSATKAEALSAVAGIGSLAAGVLLRRGVDTPEGCRRFLTPRLDDLSDPGDILGMAEGARRLALAVRQRQRIWICGDYDVDGTSGTAILMMFLRLVGAEPRFLIPHRVKDGYGLKVPGVEHMAAEGADVAVTVDNGISAWEAAERARELGIDLIITDHHEPPERLPHCLALINPHQAGCGSAYKELCGAGLAFKLAWAVAQELGPGRKATPEVREFLLDALGLVALATVADAAPLDGENRVLVRFGMKALEKSRLPGLVALKRLAKAEGELTERDLAFGLGPRINAGGRLAAADLSVRLLTTRDEAEAGQLAQELERLNKERREVERGVVESARSRAEASLTPVVMMGDEGWHLGVLGIAASKLAERFSRPVLLAAIDPETGLAKGSGRSVPGFNLTEALTRAKDHLVAYGGHAYAAGFTVKRENLEAVRLSIEASLLAWSGGEKPMPLTTVDMEIPLDRLREGPVRELARMAPYGEGNRPPVFLVRGLRLAGDPKRMGVEGKHLSFLVRSISGGGSMRAVAFNQGEGLDRLLAMREGFDLAFTPKINEWKGSVSVELEVVAVREARKNEAAGKA